MNQPLFRGSRFLLNAACLVVVIAGVKAASSVILPFLVAAFLAILCIPPMRRLQKLGVPEWLSLVLIVSGATAALLIVSAVVGSSIAEFRQSLPVYEGRIRQLEQSAFAWLSSVGVDTGAEFKPDVSSGSIMKLVADAAGGLLSMLSNLFLVVLTMVFMLLEANGIPRKLRRAMRNPDADLSQFRQAAQRVQDYLFIKAIISAGTGLLVTLLVLACGVDFPILWGLVAFLFNFVPNIGSLIAAVPAVMLATLQHGLLTGLLVAAGYVVVNTVMGNVVEPRVMGRRLGLSTLVVFLSLLVWGWIWGPVGMLLSVPLTVIIKIVLEHSTDFRWLAVILGPAEDQLDVTDSP